MKLNVLAIFPKTATSEGKVTFLATNKDSSPLEISVPYKKAGSYGAAVKEAAETLATLAEKIAERAKKMSE
jgi:hypothetical protein